MTPLVERDEIAKAWGMYCDRMKRGSQPLKRRNGWRGGGGEYTVYWHSSQGIWATLGTDWEHGRHWCGLGTDNPMSVRNLGQACQINPPIEGMSRSWAGLFVRDGNGAIYLAHSGKVGGGRPGISKSGFVTFYTDGESAPVTWPDRTTARVFILARVDADDLVDRVARFVRAVERYKQSAVAHGGR
jgi:hypothetical protein